MSNEMEAYMINVILDIAKIIVSIGILICLYKMYKEKRGD